MASERTKTKVGEVVVSTCQGRGSALASERWSFLSRVLNDEGKAFQRQDEAQHRCKVWNTRENCTAHGDLTGGQSPQVHMFGLNPKGQLLAPGSPL